MREAILYCLSKAKKTIYIDDQSLLWSFLLVPLYWQNKTSIDAVMKARGFKFVEMIWQVAAEEIIPTYKLF